MGIIKMMILILAMIIIIVMLIGVVATALGVAEVTTHRKYKRFDQWTDEYKRDKGLE